MGPTLPDYLERRLKAGETVGVILFGGNAPTEAGTKKLTASIQKAAGGDALVMTDQEGGDIRSLAFTSDIAGIREAGVNINLAPVADVAQPGSVMEGRAFSGDVSAQTVAAVKELTNTGVGATVKHFPGIGRAVENTDDAPVTIDATRQELDTDLDPFRAAIEADAPLVMAGHALYPAFDPDQIASQSPAVLQSLLRQELGFEGAVITDSLEADAVLSRSSVEVAAERSLAAGADLLLMTGQGSWIHVFPYLLKRARKSPALRERIAESYERVQGLKQRLGLLE
jgi:beta-N-acetylhexosaminidase